MRRKMRFQQSQFISRPHKDVNNSRERERVKFTICKFTGSQLLSRSRKLRMDEKFEVQNPSKRLFLGCVNSPQPGRGITQPRNSLFEVLCIISMGQLDSYLILGGLTGQLVEGADVAAGHELVGQVRLAHLGSAEHEDGVPVHRQVLVSKSSYCSTGWSIWSRNTVCWHKIESSTTV